jgi:hypothetical protein
MTAVLHAFSDLSKTQENNNNDSKKHVKDTLFHFQDVLSHYPKRFVRDTKDTEYFNH